LALSIVVTGVGVGALIFAPLINHLILSYGWRNAFLLVGIVFFIIITASALVIRPSPMETKTVVDRLKKVQKSQGHQTWPTGKIITTPAFISIAFVFCVAFLAFNTLSVHLVPYAVDLGFSSTASAVALGLVGGFSIPGRLLSGFMSDRIGWQKVLALSLFGMALSLTLLLFLKAQWMLYCFVILYGFCHGSRIPSQVGIISRFFGMDSLGELLGITMAIAQLSGALAPYITGFIFDSTGSYFVAFIIVMVFLLSGGIVTLMMKQPPIAINMP